MDELRGELERKGVDMKLLEEKQDATQNRVTVLESEIEKYNLALSAVSLCETYKHGGYCPIINKIKNENKTKRSTKNGSKKENGWKKAGTYVGSKKIKSALIKKGYSDESAGAIVGSIARKKYGNKGAAALAAYGRKNKK